MIFFHLPPVKLLTDNTVLFCGDVVMVSAEWARTSTILIWLDMRLKSRIQSLWLFIFTADGHRSAGFAGC